MSVTYRNTIYLSLAIISSLLMALGFLPAITLLLLFMFAISLEFYRCFLNKNKPSVFYTCWILAVCLGVAVGTYRPSGFSYPLVFSVHQLHAGGLPFDLYINIAKTLAGYSILLLLLNSQIKNNAYIKSPGKQITVVVFLTLLIMLIAYCFLGLHIFIKNLNYIVAFGLINLLTTCVAEEGFMRLLLQAQMHGFVARYTQSRLWQELIPLLITTCFFVLMHFTHHLDILLVYGLVGFFYGLAYTLTKNIFMVIMLHFAVNILHFSFFTYPLQ